MRDDSRPQDVFAWTRPWVPYGEDPFVWYDPAEDLKRAPAPEQAPRAANDARPAAAAAESVQAPEPVISRPATAESDDDIWVELPAIEDKPKRARRGRGRGRGEAPADAVAEAQPPAAAEAVIEPLEAPVSADEAAPAAKKPRGRRKAPAAEAAPAEPVFEAAAAEIAPLPEPEPEPVLTEAAPAPAPREPDPAEITAPPAAPRRGWWRRG